MTEKLSVGQTLWFVPSYRHYGQPQDVVVVSIGRKWADIGLRRGRLDIATLDVHSPNNVVGQCHIDKDAYLSEMKRLGLWRNLKESIRDLKCPDVSIEQIEHVAGILGIKLGEY